MSKTLLLAAVLLIAGSPAIVDAAPKSTAAASTAASAASAPVKAKKHFRSLKSRKGAASAAVPIDSPYKPGQN